MPAYRPTNKSADLRTNISQPEAARLFNVSERMIRGGSKNPLDFWKGIRILKLRKFLPEGHRYGFCCFSKPYLVMESATRKGREVRKSLRNSMAFFYGRDER